MPHLLKTLEGRYWLPNRARYSRRGVLQDASRGGFELTVDRGWSREVMQDLDARNGLVLLGRTSDHRPVTLHQGFLKNCNLFSPETSSATFFFNQIILGAHLHNAADAAITEVGVRISNLDRWLGVSGFRIDYDQFQAGKVSIHFSRPKELEVELEPGLKLVFSFTWQGLTLTHPQLEASLEQGLWLSIRALPARPFAELRHTASQLLDLFTLLVGEPLVFEAMDAEPPTQGSRPERIDIFFSPVGRDVVEVVEAHRMVIPFRDIEPDLPRLLACWLASAKTLQPAFDLYFSMLRRDPGYQEIRFLGIVRALESLHRLRKKEQPSAKHEARIARILTPLNSKDGSWLKGHLRYSYELRLAERIKELLQPFGNLFGESDLQALFVTRVVDTRNYLTHYDPALKSRAVEPSKLLPYQYRLQVLFILHCLVELGFSASAARKIIEKNDKLSQMVRFGEL
jgi:hypothetical protein